MKLILILAAVVVVGFLGFEAFMFFTAFAVEHQVANQILNQALAQ